ncbi:hypothetical protein [Geodermatophilus sp. SYSU D00766]
MPVSGARTGDSGGTALDAQLDELARAVREQCPSLGRDVVAIGCGHCEEEQCFESGVASYPHLHLETVLVRDEDGALNTAGHVLTGMPDHLLADHAGWTVPDLYRTMPTDANGPWTDPDVDIWLNAAALRARADVLR